MNEASYLARAIALATDGMREGLGGPFGAVVVHQGRIIAEASNEVVASNDPTAHAEVLAIRRAASALATFSLRGTTLYASCEPCPMCLGAIFWSRVDAVVYAATRSDAARAGFDDEAFYGELARSPAERSIPIRHALLQGRVLY